MTAAETITVAAGEVRLGARRWFGAAARPVLLVHGLASNARLWDLVGARLAGQGHPVLAVDLRGHGSSAAAPVRDADPTRVAASDLAAVCAAAGWTAPVVAGQSWGGNVVLQLAADCPDLVHGLVLVDGGWLHLGDRFDSLNAAWDVLEPPRFEGHRPDQVRRQLAEAHPDWPDGAVDGPLASFEELPDGTVAPWLSRDRHHRVVGSLLAHRPRELYPRVRCRCVLLAASSGDPLVAEAMAALSRGSRLEEFPGGDHDLHLQHPDRVAAAIAGLA